MAPDDRERTFEKALARHLRPTAPRGPDANSPADLPVQAAFELCPDAEILAAYHDGVLSSEERNLWKQHVLSCDRCQFVLSHLETPLDAPVHLETGENVAALQPALAARNRSPVPIATPRRPQSLRWLWLVPAGAIAATLVAWVSLQEKKPVQVVPSSPVEIADNRQPSSVAPLAKSAPAPQQETRERKEADKLQAPSVGGATGAGAVDRDLASKQPQNQLQLSRQFPSQSAANPPHGPSFTAQKQEQQIGRIAAGTAGAYDQKKALDAQASSGAIGGRSTGGVVPQIPVPAVPPPPASLTASEPSFLDDGAISANLKDQERSAAAPAPSSKPAAPKAKVATGDAISSIAESVAVSAAQQTASGVPERGMLRAAALQNPHVLRAPGGKQAWRIGLAGSLEHSKDKGLTWTPQISGVYTDLFAGSAPSGRVCWIVGSSGTIVRTTDGGTHWTKVDSPVTNDLTGIRATDATHARMWFVADQQTGLITAYETNDGGATWSAVSNP